MTWKNYQNQKKKENKVSKQEIKEKFEKWANKDEHGTIDMDYVYDEIHNFFGGELRRGDMLEILLYYIGE